MVSGGRCLVASLSLTTRQAEMILVLCSLPCMLHIAIAWRLPSWQTSLPPQSQRHQTARQGPPPQSGQPGRRAAPLRRPPGVQREPLRSILQTARKQAQGQLNTCRSLSLTDRQPWLPDQQTKAYVHLHRKNLQ